jgi:anti-anti-sigma regulatory factor
MNQRAWSKHLVIVKLPGEPHTYGELETVIQVAVNRPGSDMIIDFSGIESIEQRSMLSLVVLNRILQKAKAHLGFCHIHPAIKKTLQQHGLSNVIETRPDKDIILEPLADAEQGGTLILANKGERYEKRHYQRLSLSKWLKISVQLWHIDKDAGHAGVPPSRYWEGTLADVCEGGVQVVIDVMSEPDFHKGQCVRLRFAPIAYDTPVTFDAQIREHLTTANEENICLGLQFSGLEANPEGHLKLQRLCTAGLRYFETTAQDKASSIQAEPKAP